MLYFLVLILKLKKYCFILIGIKVSFEKLTPAEYIFQIKREEEKNGGNDFSLLPTC
jgi:hypothetical protein